MKKLMMMAMVASTMVTGAYGAEKITVDKVSNHYPWDGKLDCVTTLSGLETSGYDYEGVFTLSVTKDGENVSKTVTNAFASADGTYTNTFDCAALFGAGLYLDGNIAVDLVKVKQLGGGQLWKDGPYWAECNVGASKPEECGYYFSWGDTNAYVRNANNNGWVSVKDGTTLSGGFSEGNCATWGVGISDLKSNGYIDSTTGNLVAAHDAATAHLGGPWRMPTDAEFQALVDNCTTKWITTNGVSGRLITGKGEYASSSIFLPVAGYGDANYLSLTSRAYFWSSTPDSSSSDNARYIYSSSTKDLTLVSRGRRIGHSVRPVRTVDKSTCAGEVVSSAEGVRFAVDAREVKDTTLEGGVIVAGESNLVLQCSPSAWGAAAGGSGVTVAYSNATTGDAGTIAEQTTAETVDWTPNTPGTFVLTHTVATDGDPLVLSATFAVPAQVGDDAWAYVNDGTCTITGTGATWAKSEWPGENHPLAAYSTEIMNVVVQNGVTGLGSQMFENFRYITDVSLASSVESVGAKVFHKCYSLTNVTSAATTSMNIGNGAFMRCNSLETMAFTANPNWDEQSFKIQAAIRMDGDTPVVYAIPSITIGGEAPHVWGKVKLTDANWTDITDLTPAAKRDYHFFKLETK